MEYYLIRLRAVMLKKIKKHLYPIITRTLEAKKPFNLKSYIYIGSMLKYSFHTSGDSVKEFKGRYMREATLCRYHMLEKRYPTFWLTLKEYVALLLSLVIRKMFSKGS